MVKLYKYTKIEYAISAIRNGIYAGKVTDFNDPYEYEGITYPDNYRICCLTKSAKKMLMWAYYGMHKECCIKYEVPEDIDIIKEVAYIENYYQHRNMDEREIFEHLYTKSKEWNHEKETRIVFYEPDYDENLWNIVNNDVYFSQAKVTGIILGLNTKLDTDEIQELFRFVENYNNNQRYKKDMIGIKKCQISSQCFGIQVDKQFDYVRNIIH